jgi:very-short-patch-repair endonuclease
LSYVIVTLRKVFNNPMPVKKTTPEFIQSALKVHGDKYDYSLVEYIDSYTKVKIVCPVHGVFNQRPNSHTQGRGCISCGLIETHKNHKKTTNDFIEKVKLLHGDKYDYSMSEYIGRASFIKIICNQHGVFRQRAGDHLKGSGCAKCAGKVKKTTNMFIVDAEKAHGSRYDYSLVKYLSCESLVKIVCKDHGVFKQRPKDHIKGRGCDKCGGTAKKSTNEFISEAEHVHGNRYDYSLVEYINNRNKVQIICREHGKFEQVAGSHLGGSGCIKCAGTAKKSIESFITDAKKVHGDKYDYSQTEYIRSKLKVKITCPVHGVFKQSPNSHLRGAGCFHCATVQHSEKQRSTTDEFIKKAAQVHGSRYDYSLVEYSSAISIVKVICREHGMFEQIPHSHLKGAGCSVCASDVISQRLRHTTDQFIEKAKSVHGEQYDYSKINYNNGKVPVTLICKHHGLFNQKPNTHLNGSGCPRCRASKGELKIRDYLMRCRIEFCNEKRFEFCRYKAILPFDFFIPSLNLLIEYDGELHFIPITYFGGEKALKATQKRDSIKTAFAKKYGFRLLRIKYTEYDRIEEILTAVIFGDETGQLRLFAA